MICIDRLQSTHCSRRGFSWGAIGLLQNLTFARAVGKVNDGDSGRSNVASVVRENISAERLHSETVYSHCRPKTVTVDAAMEIRTADAQSTCVMRSREAAETLESLD